MSAKRSRRLGGRKTLHERRFGELCKVPWFNSEHWFSVIQSPHVTKRDFINSESIVRNFSRKCLIAVVLWRRYSDWKIENLDASEIYLRRINAEEVLVTQKKIHILSCCWFSKLIGKGYEFRERTSRQEKTVRSESLRGEIEGETEARQPANMKDDVEAFTDFWSTSSVVITMNQVFNYVPKQETFFIPLTMFSCHKNNTHR